MKKLALLLGILCVVVVMPSEPADQKVMYNGLNLSLGNLSRLSHAKTRSISPENFTGEKGKAGMATQGTGSKAARDLGQGWKISPSIDIGPKQVFTPGRHPRARGHSAYLDDPHRTFSIFDIARFLGR